MSKPRHAVRLWDNQVVVATVCKQFLFMQLVAYDMRVYRDGNYLYKVREMKWFPSWRVFERSTPPNSLREEEV